MPQNPGIAGLQELTNAEKLFIQNLAGLSYSQGDMLYYNSGNLTRLPIGSAGQILQVNAGGTAPEWEDFSALAIGATVTSGTEGSVLFVGSAGALSQDNSNFFWDDSNNRLGIGTSSPTTTLHVIGDALLGGNNTARSLTIGGYPYAVQQLIFSGTLTSASSQGIRADGNTGELRIKSNSYITFYPLNSEAMRIASTGAVTLSSLTNGLVKSASGVLSNAVSGTDYAPATSGSSILYGNGSGGFSNVTVGTGLSFSTGTLSTTITQYTDELAQDAVGSILLDSSEIDFTYDDATPSITAVLKSASIDESKLDTSVNASLDLADTAVQPARSISAGTGLTGGGSLAADRTISLSSGSIASLALADSALQNITGLIDEGTNITITGTGTPGDPYMITAAGGASGGQVDSVVAGTGISVDATDPVNPIVSTTITQYTDELAQDAVGGILTDSSEIDFTYNDGTPSITASIVASSIDESKLDTSVNASLDLADTSVQPARTISAGTGLTGGGTLAADRTISLSSGSIASLALADTAIQNLAGLGVTATAAELNILDGATLTTTELNYVDGVTSAIQTQLDGKQATGNYITALTGDVTASGPGSVAATLATVNSNVGSFTYGSFTVNAKGLITAASSGTTPYVPGGTDVAVADGGTNISSYTTGDLLYASGSGTLSKRAIGSTGDVLTVSGGLPVWAAPSGGGITVDYQSFTASGTWTKPSGLSSNAMIFIMMWGGGGGASGRGTTSGGGTSGGGGGGGCFVGWFHASTFTSTVAVTIGAGGVAGTSDGGNSTFGSYFTAYGGANGGTRTGSGNNYGAGGGGGGILSKGEGGGGASTGNPVTGGSGGAPNRVVGTTSTGGDGLYGGAGGGATSAGAGSPPTGGAGGNSVYGGGGGGCGGGSISSNGGNSIYGGGGGGGGLDGGGPAGAGGTSLYGGAGGAGTGVAPYNDGVAPGGGGGGGYRSGSIGAAGGNGARGECRIWTYEF